MDEWMNEWMNEWMDEWMDEGREGVDGGMDGCRAGDGVSEKELRLITTASRRLFTVANNCWQERSDSATTHGASCRAPFLEWLGPGVRRA